MKVGIIGCGLMGQRRAAHLEPDDVLVGGYDVSYPETWKAPRIDFEELIDKSEALVVATPHHLLASAALACVRAGKHVLLEKPCARSAAELLPVLDAASANRVVVVPGFTLRHYPGIQMARDYLESGTHCMRAIYGHPGRPGYGKEWRCDPRGGGELLDQGVHLIDLTHFFFGPAILGDYKSQCGAWGDVEDTVFLRLETVGGTAILQASWVEPQPVFRTEIIGKGCSAVITGLGGHYGTHVVSLKYPSLVNSLHWPSEVRDLALDAEWQFFKTAVREGRSHLQDAMDVLKIVDEARAR